MGEDTEIGNVISNIEIWYTGSNFNSKVRWYARVKHENEEVKKFSDYVPEEIEDDIASWNAIVLTELSKLYK